MTWLQLETDWLRAGGHCWFAPDDDRAIEAFETHLRETHVPYVKRERFDAPAIVLEPSPVEDVLAA